MAQTHVAGDEDPPSSAFDVSGGSPESTAETDATLFMARDTAQRNEPSTTPLTLAHHAQRSVVALVVALVGVILFAPVILATAAAIWALTTEGLAVLSIERLLRHGEILQTGPAMNALSVASRIGFVAVGYLGLFCALMALLAGMLGRGRGRLFVVPGALLTASALILFATSIALSAPLLETMHAPHAAWVGGALYLTVDTVTLATLLADTRDTRRRWLKRPRIRAKATQTQREPPGLPPTLAGV